MTHNRRPAHRPWALLALGFRPFFLAAGVAAVALMAVWLARLGGLLPMDRYYGPVYWHAHEMLFGYAAAVIAGFLLTAVRNWTGRQTLAGLPLAALALVWVAGRLLPFLPLPGVVIAVVDLAFLPLLALALVPPLFSAGPGPNRFLPLLLLAMAGANLLMHLGVLLPRPELARQGEILMLDLVLWLVLLIGGRVLPFFMEARLGEVRCRSNKAVERATFVLVAALVLVDPWWPGMPAAVTALALGLVQAVRVAGWHDRRLWSEPMLSVLYLAYVWTAAGLVLRAGAALDLVPAGPALHAWTVGGIGGMTLGMMVRVSQGHTGRPVRATPLAASAFLLLQGGALLRVLGPWFWPAATPATLQAAGALWMAAFVLFLAGAAPLLLRPRPDGRPG